jgi:hypothetical protein
VADVTCVSDDSDSGAVLADAVVEVVMGGVGGGVDATESQSIVVCTCVVHVAGACVTIGAMSSSPLLVVDIVHEPRRCWKPSAT